MNTHNQNNRKSISLTDRDKGLILKHALIGLLGGIIVLILFIIVGGLPPFGVIFPLISAVSLLLLGLIFGKHKRFWISVITAGVSGIIGGYVVGNYIMLEIYIGKNKELRNQIIQLLDKEILRKISGGDTGELIPWMFAAAFALVAFMSVIGKKQV